MNSEEDYFRAYKFFEEKYAKLGMNDFDYFYIYSDFRGFASEMGKNLARNEFCSAVIKPLIEKNKTVIIPTYTYTVKGVFEVLETPTRLGALNSWILQQPNVCRSEHPLFSFASLGPGASLVENCGKSAFGENSVHQRLVGKRACVLHIGIPIYLANTLIHHVEQLCGATYRINKYFKTKIFKNGKYLGTDYNAFLRRRDVPEHDFHFDLKRASEKLYKTKIPKEIGDPKNLSNITLCGYDKLRSFFIESFLDDASIFLSEKFVQY